MEKVCPVCNEINYIEYKCKKCGRIMVDMGRKQEYFDDYSADDPIEDVGEYCIHFFECDNCKFTEEIRIRKIIM